MRFETQALRDSCFYGRHINPFYACMYVIKLAYNPSGTDDRLKLIASALTDLRQYSSSPGRRAIMCYAELAVSSPAVTKITARTNCTYAQTKVALINIGISDPPRVATSPSANRARRSTTMLI